MQAEVELKPRRRLFRRRLGAAGVGGPLINLGIAIVILIVIAFVAAYIVGYMYQTLPSQATSLSFVQNILGSLNTGSSAFGVLFIVVILVAFILLIFYLLMLGGVGGGGGAAPGA